MTKYYVVRVSGPNAKKALYYAPPFRRVSQAMNAMGYTSRYEAERVAKMFRHGVVEPVREQDVSAIIQTIEYMASDEYRNMESQ
jgi:hypothetical protein